MIFVIEIRNHKVWLTISVEIRSIDSHTRLRQTARVVGDLGVDRGVFKCAIPVVEEEQIRRRITGHKEIGPAIIIHIDRYHAEGPPDQVRESAFLAQDRKSTRLNSSHRCISYAV